MSNQLAGFLLTAIPEHRFQSGDHRLAMVPLIYVVPFFMRLTKTNGYSIRYQLKPQRLSRLVRVSTFAPLVSRGSGHQRSMR